MAQYYVKGDSPDCTEQSQSGKRYTHAMTHANCRIKWYPGEVEPCEVMAFPDDIFRLPGFEEFSTSNSHFIPSEDPGEDSGEVPSEEPAESEREPDGAHRAWHRARRRAYDLIRSNAGALNMFVTLTMDAKQVDRTDYRQIVGRLNRWLDNRVRRKGLRYVLCPEYHKDGESIHFHGLMNEKALNIVNSGHKRKGKVVYNIEDFPLGFTTAIRVTGEDAGKACAGYIFKYMGKQGDQKIGGRYFLHGGKLQEPVYTYHDADYRALNVPEKEMRWGGAFKAAYGENAALAAATLGIRYNYDMLIGLEHRKP